MDKYELRSTQEQLIKFLNIYKNETFYEKNIELTQEDKYIFDNKNLKFFFVELLKQFDLKKYISLGDCYLKSKIEIWNNNNIEKKIELKDLENNLCIIKVKNKIIINPYISKLLNKNKIYNNKYLNFLKTFDLKTYQYFYLFWDKKFLSEFIDEYNIKYNTNLTLDYFIRDKESLDSSIFKYFKEIFSESLKLYFITITYSDWESNIEKYFYILFELYKNRIITENVSILLSSSKKATLSKFIKNVLLIDKEIVKFEDINFLEKLPYFFQKINFEYESESSHSKFFDYEITMTMSIAPYKKTNLSEMNIFSRVEKITRMYKGPDCFEILSFYSSLYYFSTCNDFIKDKEFKEIITQLKSTFYKYLVSDRLEFNSSNIIHYDFIDIAPFIIYNILNLETHHKLESFNFINIGEFKFELLKNYIQILNSDLEKYIPLLLDLYLYINIKFESNELNLIVTKKLRNFIIIEITKNAKSSNSILENIFRKFENLNIEDFEKFDLLIKISNAILTKEINLRTSNIILENYFSLLEKDFFSNTFSNILGIENIFFSFNTLENDTFIEKIINRYDFIYLIKINPNKKDLYKLGRKLRFHIGLLCNFITKSSLEIETKEKVLEYIFENFKELKSYLSWNDLILDSCIYDNTSNIIINKNELITNYIAQFLSNRDEKYVKKYFESISELISLPEMILFKKHLNKFDFIRSIKLENLFPQKIEASHINEVKKTAYFLIRNGFPEQGIKFINYIESFDEERKSYFIDDNLLNLKFEAFLLLKNFNDAKMLLRMFYDKKTLLAKEGLLCYLKEDYLKAESLFEKFLATNEKNVQVNDIINYSATLIQLKKNEAAIKLIENFIVKYNGNEYLLYLNLGLAYSKVNKVTSLYFFIKSEELFTIQNEELEKKDFITLNILQTLKNLQPEFVDIINKSDVNLIKTEIINDYIEQSQNSIRKISKFNIDETEKKILKELYNKIQVINNNIKQIEGFSEDRLSTYIKDLVSSMFLEFGITIERERRGGYSVKKEGEIDLYIYFTKSEFLISVGENKEWKGEDKFRRQIQQLLGYMHYNVPFGFTITYLKSDISIVNVEKIKKKVLEEFTNEIEFTKSDPIYDAENLFTEKFFLRDVLLTIHKNPEKENYFRLYHFTIDASSLHRKNIAKKARERKINK